MAERGHRCAADHCGRTIPWHLLMCGQDWARVPTDVQQQVHRTYQARQDDWAAYERAVDAAKDAVRRAAGGSTRPLPPPPTGGRPCGYGDGNAAEGWRWVKATREWTPVCHSHNGSTRAVRAGDYVPDIARVPRAAAVGDGRG